MINEQIAKKCSAALYYKDKEGKYECIDSRFLSGYDNLYSENDIIGRRDIDLWNGNAPAFPINDQKVIFYERKEIFIEEHLFKNTKRIYLSYKSPWYSASGKLIGLAGASILLNSDYSITNPFESLSSLFLKNEDTTLSLRQKECLCYLTKGMTTKQIADAMLLSPKTIEHHLDKIKFKLNCSNRFELVKKAFQLGLA